MDRRYVFFLSSPSQPWHADDSLRFRFSQVAIFLEELEAAHPGFAYNVHARYRHREERPEGALVHQGASSSTLLPFEARELSLTLLFNLVSDQPERRFQPWLILTESSCRYRDGCYPSVPREAVNWALLSSVSTTQDWSASFLLPSATIPSTSSPSPLTPSKARITNPRFSSWCCTFWAPFPNHSWVRRGELTTFP